MFRVLKLPSLQMASSIIMFEDIFVVDKLDPDGKKFDKGTHFLLTSITIKLLVHVCLVWFCLNIERMSVYFFYFNHLEKLKIVVTVKKDLNFFVSPICKFGSVLILRGFLIRNLYND